MGINLNSIKRSAEKAAQQKRDNTEAKKPVTRIAEKVDYEYMGTQSKVKGTPTSKDSSDYKKGFSTALERVSKRDKDYFGYKYEKGSHWVGLNDRFNEGFSEGKDKMLDRKNKKK